MTTVDFDLEAFRAKTAAAVVSAAAETLRRKAERAEQRRQLA